MNDKHHFRTKGLSNYFCDVPLVLKILKLNFSIEVHRHTFAVASNVIYTIMTVLMI